MNAKIFLLPLAIVIFLIGCIAYCYGDLKQYRNDKRKIKHE